MSDEGLTLGGLHGRNRRPRSMKRTSKVLSLPLLGSAGYYIFNSVEMLVAGYEHQLNESFWCWRIRFVINAGLPPNRFIGVSSLSSPQSMVAVA